MKLRASTSDTWKDIEHSNECSNYCCMVFDGYGMMEKVMEGFVYGGARIQTIS